MINPAGVRHQIHGNVIQSLSRTLYETVHFDATARRFYEAPFSPTHVKHILTTQPPVTRR